MEPLLNKSCIFCVVLIFFCPAVTAPGRVIYVDDDEPADFNNIQAAIDDTNDADVVIVADGTYTGDGNWDINFKGKAITVRSANGPENCVIDCMAPGWTDHRGFLFRSGEDNRSVLSGFTVTNGRGYWGGGILCDGSSPTIQNNIIMGNAARGDGEIPGLGGGIYCANSYAVIVGNVIANNGASFGGGICARNSSLTLRNNLLGRNHASGTSVIFCSPGQGGAIDCVRSSLVLINNTILSNYAHATYCWGGIPGEGGGIHCGDSAVTVLNSILWGNDPAALWLDDDSTVEIRYSDIQGGWLGKGNVDTDPCFATVASWVEPLEPNILDDWHLKSQAGRFDSISGSWVYDEVTSPCIDAADPMSPIGHEPFPNGGIINMGAYGGTMEASKSYFGEPVCETVVAGDINGDCKIDFIDFAIMAAHWLEDNSPSGPVTTAYVFQPDPNALVVSGGFAGHIHETYSVEGQFKLMVNFDEGTASFEEVDATLSEEVCFLDPESEGFRCTDSLGVLFQMTELVSTDVNHTRVKFALKRFPGFPEADIHLEFIFLDDSVRLVGGFCEPVSDGVCYRLDAHTVPQLAADPEQ